jgi:hypothetical protein
MSVSNSTMSLDSDQLNDLDGLILDYLRDDGRATPTLLQRELEARGEDPGVRQNVNARLTRLAEHEHVINKRDSGVYEFVDDPRV